MIQQITFLIRYTCVLHLQEFAIEIEFYHIHRLKCLPECDNMVPYTFYCLLFAVCLFNAMQKAAMTLLFRNEHLFRKKGLFQNLH